MDMVRSGGVCMKKTPLGAFYEMRVRIWAMYMSTMSISVN